jgi:regulator of protease activity HflC (stomatin/prohibitin superfamily)
VKVERVEIKNLALPQELTRTMAAEAEAARTARAQLIYSEAEKRVSSIARHSSDRTNCPNATGRKRSTSGRQDHGRESTDHAFASNAGDIIMIDFNNMRS